MRVVRGEAVVPAERDRTHRSLHGRSRRVASTGPGQDPRSVALERRGTLLTIAPRLPYIGVDRRGVMPLSNLAIRDIETLAHPNTNLAQLRETGPLVIERGKGVYVYDSEGKPYLEGMAGLWCTALGYGNEELAETAAAEMKKLGFSHL